MRSTESVIELRGLRKAFGTTLALDGLELEVARGEVHGFLGPNGAGKSTFIALVLAPLLPGGVLAETVFSHPSKLDLLDEAHARGYTVVVHALLIPEELAVERVARRVSAGGHRVPQDKIREVPEVSRTVGPN